MPLDLGPTPDVLTVHLTRHADFVQTLVSQDAEGADVAWEDDETLVLVFGDGTTWPATLAGNEATWNVDKAEVNSLDVRTVELRYTAGTFDATWARGAVRVR